MKRLKILLLQLGKNWRHLFQHFFLNGPCTWGRMPGFYEDEFAWHEFHVRWGRASVTFHLVQTDIRVSAHVRTHIRAHAHTHTHTHTHFPARSLSLMAHYHALSKKACVCMCVFFLCYCLPSHKLIHWLIAPSHETNCKRRECAFKENYYYDNTNNCFVIPQQVQW